jgi:hypothetical protein
MSHKGGEGSEKYPKSVKYCPNDPNRLIHKVLTGGALAAKGSVERVSGVHGGSQK